MKIEDMTNKQLKEEFKEYYNIVNNEYMAHSTTDVRIFYALQAELDKRDIEYSTKIQF